LPALPPNNHRRRAVRPASGKITHLIQCKHTSNIEAGIDAGLAVDIARMNAEWRAVGARLVGITNARDFSLSVKKAAKIHDAILYSRDKLHDLKELFLSS
jgi:hypothetical protein